MIQKINLTTLYISLLILFCIIIIALIVLIIVYANISENDYEMANMYTALYY